jgi:hypothetical protein
MNEQVWCTDGIILTADNWSTVLRGNSVSVLLYSPQIPHGLSRDWTQAIAERGRWHSPEPLHGQLSLRCKYIQEYDAQLKYESCDTNTNFNKHIQRFEVSTSVVLIIHVFCDVMGVTWCTEWISGNNNPVIQHHIAGHLNPQHIQCL